MRRSHLSFRACLTLDSAQLSLLPRANKGKTCGTDFLMQCAGHTLLLLRHSRLCTVRYVLYVSVCPRCAVSNLKRLGLISWWTRPRGRAWQCHRPVVRDTKRAERCCDQLTSDAHWFIIAWCVSPALPRRAIEPRPLSVSYVHLRTYSTPQPSCGHT